MESYLLSGEYVPMTTDNQTIEFKSDFSGSESETASLYNMKEVSGSLSPFFGSSSSS